MSYFLNSARLLAVCLGLSSCVAGPSTNENDSALDGENDVVCIELAPDCPDGQVPGDTDNDGCALECVPDPTVCIEIAPDCAAGEVPGDTDGDGCALECVPELVACIEIAPDCAAGEVPGDTDGDGCALECVADPTAP